MSLNQLYRALKISKQGVHHMLKRHQKSMEIKHQLLPLVHQIRHDHPTMGVRDMYSKLPAKIMGRDTFEAFCRENFLQSKPPKNYRRTTDSSGVVRFDNLMGTVELTKTDLLWQSDITYFEIKGKFYFLTFIIDSYSRRILGYNASKRLFTEQTTLPALQMAIKMRGNKKLDGLVFHSDGGGQYYDAEFLKLTGKYNLKNSMCEYAWENGKAERINGVIKNNYLRHRKINTYEDLVKELDRSVYLYNTDKPHIGLQRMTPIAFENKGISLIQQTTPKMTKSLNAKRQILGASSPKKSEQTLPLNQNVLPQ